MPVVSVDDEVEGFGQFAVPAISHVPELGLVTADKLFEAEQKL